jgi:hypothetical protein
MGKLFQSVNQSWFKSLSLQFYPPVANLCDGAHALGAIPITLCMSEALWSPCSCDETHKPTHTR